MLGGVGMLLLLPLPGVKDIPIDLYAEVGVCEPEDDGDVLLPLTEAAFRNRKGELVRGFEEAEAMSSTARSMNNRAPRATKTRLQNSKTTSTPPSNNKIHAYKRRGGR